MATAQTKAISNTFGPVQSYNYGLGPKSQASSLVPNSSSGFPSLNPIPTNIANSNQPGSMASSINPPVAYSSSGAPYSPVPKTTAPIGGGNSTTAAPSTSATPSEPPMYDSNTGMITDYGKSKQSSQPSQPNAYGPYPNASQGSFQSNLNAVAQAANTNPIGQGAANASALYGMLGQNAQLQPFAGGQTQGLNQSFANLTRPQSTGNLQGEEGLFNTQNAIFQNAANTSAQQALQQQGYGLQGAENIAGLTAPQPYGITSTPYQPGTGQFGQLAGSAASVGNGLVGAGILQGQLNAGQNLVQNAQAIGKAIPIAQNLDSLIKQNNINPTTLTAGNALINFLRTNIGSDPAVTEFGGQINDLASTLAPALGIPGGATTDFKTSLGQAIVNGLQSGQSVSQSVQYFIQQAQQGAQGAYNGATNPLGTIYGGQGTTSAGGYNYQLVNGKWVPAQ